jgi:hypothetical protein
MVNDEPPEEGEVKEAVRKLKVDKAAGRSNKNNGGTGSKRNLKTPVSKG